MRSLVLIGFKSAGKTTYGKLLAQQLSLPFLDTDTLLGGNCSTRYRDVGEERFRELEREAIVHLKPELRVMATGGGAVLGGADPLRRLGVIVYLEMSAKELKKRLTPLPSFLRDEADLDKMVEERKPLYEKVADRRVIVEGRKESDVVEELMRIVHGE